MRKLFYGIAFLVAIGAVVGTSQLPPVETAELAE